MSGATPDRGVQADRHRYAAAFLPTAQMLGELAFTQTYATPSQYLAQPM